MRRSADLHGNVPDTCPVALLLVDVINDLEFEGGDVLLPHALPMAERLAALARRCRAVGVPVVYVNDNFGRWRSDFRTLLQRCLDDAGAGPPRRATAPARRPRLLRPQAQALRLLLDHAATSCFSTWARAPSS